MSRMSHARSRHPDRMSKCSLRAVISASRATPCCWRGCAAVQTQPRRPRQRATRRRVRQRRATGAQRRRAERPGCSRTTTRRSNACSPGSTTPRSPAKPRRCRPAIRSTTSPAVRCSSAACRCRGRSIAATGVRCRQSPARRQRRLSPAGEARRIAAVVRRPVQRPRCRCATACWPAITARAGAVRTSSSTTPPAPRRCRRRLRPRGGRRRRLHRRPAGPRRSQRAVPHAADRAGAGAQPRQRRAAGRQRELLAGAGRRRHRRRRIPACAQRRATCWCWRDDEPAARGRRVPRATGSVAAARSRRPSTSPISPATWPPRCRRLRRSPEASMRCSWR